MDNTTQHTPGPCPYCREHHDTARGFTFDGHGVNGCDMYRARLATISNHTRDGGDDIGRLFAAAPDLLAALTAQANKIAALLDDEGANITSETGDKLQEMESEIRAAIARATGN